MDALVMDARVDALVMDARVAAPAFSERQGDIEGYMGTATAVVLGLASILFLSVVLIVAALMMRGQWEKLGGPREPPTE